MRRDRWLLLGVLLLLLAASVYGASRVPWEESTGTSMVISGMHGNGTGDWNIFSVDDSPVIRLDSGVAVHELRLYAQAWEDDAAELTLAAGDRRWTVALTGETALHTVTMDCNAPEIQVGVTSGMQAQISRAEVSHSTGVNVPLLTFLWGASWGLALLLYFMTRKAPRLDGAVLCLTLCTGLMLIVVKPMQGFFSWDERVHLDMVNRLSGAALPDTGWADYLAGVSTWDTGYIPLAAGVALGRGLGLAQNDMLRLGLCLQVLTHSAFCALAVRTTPRYRLTFAVAALVPTMMFLTASFTYDVMVFDGVLLGVALWLREMDSPGKLSGTSAVGLCVLMGACTLSKVAYAPLLLLLLLLPKDKFGGKARLWLFRGFVLVLLAVCLCSVLLPGPYDAMRQGDTRFDGVDAQAQLASMASAPGRTLAMLGEYFLTTVPVYFARGLCNWAEATDLYPMGAVLLAVLLLVCPLCTMGEGATGLLMGRRRWKLAVIGLLPLLMLIVTQYVVSSAVGSWAIRGMQNRYTLPLMIVLLLALMLPEKARWVQWPGKERTLGVLCLMLTAGTSFVMAWRTFTAVPWGL